MTEMSEPCEGYVWVDEELVRCSRRRGHGGRHFGNLYTGLGGSVTWQQEEKE